MKLPRLGLTKSKADLAAEGTQRDLERHDAQGGSRKESDRLERRNYEARTHASWIVKGGWW